MGGNGLVIASLANLIALRLGNVRRGWLLFHLYSIPFMLLSAVLLYALLVH